MGALIDQVTSGDYLSATSISAGSFSPDISSNLPVTVACWIRISSYAAQDAVSYAVGLNRSGGGNNYYALGFDKNVGESDATATARVRTTTTTIDLGTTEAWSLDEWHLVVATFVSSSSRSLYLDGSSNSDVDTDTLAPTLVDSIFLGAQSAGGAQAMDGEIAHVAIWSGTLSSAEIDSLVTTAPNLLNTTGSGATLTHHWPLDDDFNDDVGSVTLTETGTVSFSGQSPYAAAGSTVPVLFHHYRMMKN